MENVENANQESKRLHVIRHVWSIKGEKRIKRYGLKSGKWSKKEEKILKDNLERYLRGHNIEDLRKLIFPNHESEDPQKWREVAKETGFYRELAQGLNRSLFAVYRKAVRSFDEKNYLGKFSQTEDKELLRLVALHGRNWIKIGAIMSRSGLSVSHRYEIIRGNKNLGPWSDEEAQRLKLAVRKLTNTSEGDEVYDKICWISVASMVKTRDNRQCRRKWLENLCWRDCTLSNAASKQWTSQNDIELITRIYESKTTDENDINWTALTNEFEMARSPAWLSQKFAEIKRKYCTCVFLQQTEFEELIDYLYNVVATDLQNNILFKTSNT